MSEDPTQISLRTVLEAINSLGVELHNFRAETEKRFGQLEAVISARLETIESSINVLSGDVTRLRASKIDRAKIEEIARADRGYGYPPDKEGLEPLGTRPEPGGEGKRT
ncbi:MAG TPA: hypothetical protein VGN95_25300 [Pyrinomonadaceae bacterium]|jgi:hypothetical protein|nr:hypothetical protein [Pyrinomonadaceae bacterium]